MHNYVPNLEKKILISDLDYGKLQDTSIFYRRSGLYMVISILNFGYHLEVKSVPIAVTLIAFYSVQ